MKVNFNRIIIPSSKDNILNLMTKFIQCKICINILNDPYDCLCCNQTFCKSCITNYIKTNNKCPFSEFFESKKDKKNENINDLLNKLKPSSSNFNKVIQSLKFYCQNKDKGCDDELSIEEISEHEKICKFNSKYKSMNSTAKKEKKDEDIKSKKRDNSNNKNNHSNNKVNKVIKRNRNNVKSQKDMSVKISIKKDENDNEDYENNNNNTMTDINKENLNSLNNQLKQQDSIISFCDLKNNLEENFSNINIFSNDRKRMSKNNILNANFEKYFEEINQKLNSINSFLTNNFDLKLNNDNFFKLNKNFDFKETSEFNFSENEKGYKNKSMAITNNYYDGSFINTINNYSNHNIDKLDYFDNMKTSSKKIPKKNAIKLNLKPNKNLLTSSKINKFQKYSKYNKTKILALLNEKIPNKKQKAKNLSILTDFENNEKSRNLNDAKNETDINLNSITKTDNYTPKLGIDSLKKINNNKKDLSTNIKLNNNNSNNNYEKIENNSPIKEDIFTLVKKLENKMNDIERIFQSNNCFKNQEYSIQYDEKNEQNQLNNSKNLNNFNKDELCKLFGEIINKKEENFKKILNVQIESLKKYILEKCVEEMKKSVLDTNIDIMTLYNDKLEEFEKILKDKKEAK